MKSGELPYNQIAHLNAELRERDLPYKINYRDRTTAGIQELGVCASIGKEEPLRVAVREFFQREGMAVEFSASGLEILAAEHNSPGNPV